MASRAFAALPLGLVAATLALPACRAGQDADPPVATPVFSANHARAALGSPIEVTYRFAVAPNAPPFRENYRVLVHFLDSNEELMWTEDHDPPISTTEWKAGRTVEYMRTLFLPLYPYVGEATVEMGLYSVANRARLPLEGENRGQRSYKVATLELLPQTENVFLMFKDGWHPAEPAEDNPSIEWQWSRKDASIAFRNPRRPVVLYLDLDNPGSVFNEPQTVGLRIGTQALDSFVVNPGQRLIRKLRLTPEQMGGADMAEIRLQVDKTYVPALLLGSTSRDPRELGVRVFHAFVEPQ